MAFSTILAEAKNGSTQALGEVLQSCESYIRTLATQSVPERLQGRVSPSSLMQETYLKACGAFEHFRGDSEAQLFSWLRQILLRCMQNQLRLRCHQTTLLPLSQEVAAKDEYPGNEIMRQERIQACKKALAQLSNRHQFVIQLRQIEGLSFVQIGKILACTDEAARKLWERALIQLGKKLEERP